MLSDNEDYLNLQRYMSDFTVKLLNKGSRVNVVLIVCQPRVQISIHPTCSRSSYNNQFDFLITMLIIQQQHHVGSKHPGLVFRLLIDSEYAAAHTYI